MEQISHLSVWDTGPLAPCPNPFNLAQYVLARGRGDKVALEIVSAQGDEVWTYDELRRAVFGTAAGLQAAGLARGGKLLLRVGNTIDFPLLYLGTIAMGGVPVPTSAALTDHEVRYILADLEPDMVASAGGVAPPLETKCPVLDASAVRQLRDCAPAEPVQTAPDDLAYIIYTSGTSGKPRAVCHAHRAAWARQMMWTGWYGLSDNDRMLHAGAFNWTYTLGTGLIDPWSIGATALINGDPAQAALWGPLASRTRATLFAAAPGVYRQLLRRYTTGDFAHLRHGLSAGEAMPAGVQADWISKTGTQVYEALGMSEVSTFISSSVSVPPRPGSSGRGQIGRKLAVVDQNGAPVPKGSPGVLAVDRADPGLMLGYLNQPEETVSKMRGPWFLTGDRVSMDDDGYITYLGRDDDMLNAGGYRVSPLEIEEALARHPAIAQAAAVEIRPKPDTSLLVAAYVSDTPLDDAALSAHCQSLLAHYKCPRAFFHRNSLPQSANGKLQRKILREELTSAQT